MFDRDLFGKNLGDLIKTRNETQQPLADHLFHSDTKTISKWVNGKSIPSLDDVVKIAAYFDISVDELLGCNQERREKKKIEYIKEIESLLQEGKIQDCIKKCKEAQNVFPNDLHIRYELLRAFFLDDNSLKENANEMIQIGTKLLEESKEDSIRNGTIQCLCKAYATGKGDYASAIKLAMTAPTYYKSQNELLVDMKQHGTSQITLCERNINQLVELIGKNVIEIINDRTLLEADPKGLETIEYMLGFTLRCYWSLYPDGDCGIAHCRLVNLNLMMHQFLHMVGQIEDAIPYLERAARHAISYDLQEGEGQPYTSPMLRYAGKRKYNLIKGFTKSEREVVLDDINTIYKSNKPQKVIEIETKLNESLASTKE